MTNIGKVKEILIDSREALYECFYEIDNSQYNTARSIGEVIKKLSLAEELISKQEEEQ